jgi:hypothetical protein
MGSSFFQRPESTGYARENEGGVKTDRTHEKPNAILNESQQRRM